MSHIHVLWVHIADAHLFDARTVSDAHFVVAYVMDARFMGVHVAEACLMDAHVAVRSVMGASVMDTCVIEAHVDAPVVGTHAQIRTSWVYTQTHVLRVVVCGSGRGGARV